MNTRGVDADGYGLNIDVQNFSLKKKICKHELRTEENKLGFS